MHSTISLMFFCYCYKENLLLCLHTPSLKKSNKGNNDDNNNTTLYMTLFSFRSENRRARCYKLCVIQSVFCSYNSSLH